MGFNSAFKGLSNSVQTETVLVQVLV